MLALNIRRVFLIRDKVDFRKRFNGLLGEAYKYGADPYDGDCVLFIKTDRTQLRVLVGDAVGLYLICRRFESGRLRGLPEVIEQNHVSTITMAELNLLLEGACFTVHQRALPWRTSHQASS